MVPAARCPIRRENQETYPRQESKAGVRAGHEAGAPLLAAAHLGDRARNLLVHESQLFR
jgi:hypothetical protein